MAYVKSISIKTTVNKSIAYILKAEKTEGLKLVSGLNVTPDKDFAYAEFCCVGDATHSHQPKEQTRILYKL